MPMGQYSIKDLEVLSGIKAHTLRIWEQRYELVKPKRTDTNIRFYTDMQLKKILNVSLLNNSGVKISKIASMSGQEIRRAILGIDNPELAYEKYHNQLIEGMISMDKPLMKSILAKHIEFKSIEDFFMHVVLPFLTKVGLLWSSNGINPAHEHFASSIIKRFLINEIEGLPEADEDADLFVLILPNGDFHELTLLLSEYVIKREGKRALYLGASVPEEDLVKIFELVGDATLLCVGILSQTIENTQRVIDELCYLAQSRKVLFAGNVFYQANLAFPANASRVFSFEEIISV